MVNLCLLSIYCVCWMLVNVDCLQPNIIFIIADDLGWNDVSFHGSAQIPTPNIDALAYNGVILQQHYVQPMCTPSRAALMTGKYPIYTGMQGYALSVAEPRALPPGKLLPEHLRDLGYSTHLVGKWHLGYSRLNETPTSRGFDSHLGYWTGFINYYDYVHESKIGDIFRSGFDMRRNVTSAWDLAGTKYATDLFTEEAVEVIRSHDRNSQRPLFLMLSHLAPHAGNRGKPLEAPQEVIRKHDYVVDINRRTYAAMVSKLDESVGAVVAALQEAAMLDNSLIVFISDNGAPTIGEYGNWGSNYPLRGLKETLWEGGIRGVACVWSPALQGMGINNNMIHITDWLPTLISAAEGNPYILEGINGVDQWQSLIYNFYPSPRRDILLNINEKARNAAIRQDNWKLVVGIYGAFEFDGYHGESGARNTRPVGWDPGAARASTAGRALAASGYEVSESYSESVRQQATVQCYEPRESDCKPNSTASLCLFDIISDPCETKDLSSYYPRVVRQLKASLVRYRRGLIPQTNQPSSLDGVPELYNYTWSNWLDNPPQTDFRVLDK